MTRSEKILLSIFAVMFLVIVGGGALTYLWRTYSSITAEARATKKHMIVIRYPLITRGVL